MLFNSSILDVAVGLVFSFLALSLATGMIVEAISSFLKLRASTLRQGVGQLVNDPGFTALAKDLYEHAAVNPRGTGAGRKDANQPAYIEAQQFANALLDVTGMSPVLAGAASGGASFPVDALKAAVDASVPTATNAQINQLLAGIINRTLGNPAELKREIAAWFDNGMDRVSGGYKRWSQRASLIIAFGLAAALNVDAIRIGRTLWDQPAIADHLKASGSTLSLDEALTEMNTSLPVGWPQGFLMKPGVAEIAAGDGLSKANPIHITGLDGLKLVPGWLLSALATLFGAPFWFDILQRAVRLKGTGPAPASDEKKT